MSKTEKEKTTKWYKRKGLLLLNLESDNIKRAGYDLAAAKLYLEFETGVYEYTQVSLLWWLDFCRADSQGKFFAKSKDQLIHFTKLK